MNIPIEALQNIVMEQSSDKALRAVTSLSESTEPLNNAIARRNDLIEDFKNRRVPEGYSVEAMYFGLPVKGNTNKEYSSTISAIYLYNNDAIFFALKLCEYLREHALKTASKYKEISGSKIGVSEFDISAAKNQGLLPDDPSHTEWESSFTDDSSKIATDAPINLSCSRGKLQFSRHPQRHWTKSDRKIMYGELFRPVLRVKREPHPYP